MIATHIIPNIDHSPQRQFTGRNFIRPSEWNGELHIAGIPNGTMEGATVVGIAVEIPDGDVIFLEVKLDTMEAACRAIRERCGA